MIKNLHTYPIINNTYLKKRNILNQKCQRPFLNNSKCKNNIVTKNSCSCKVSHQQLNQKRKSAVVVVAARAAVAPA